jgi:UTP--glucose-1-phosphate uridylyltransferase
VLPFQGVRYDCGSKIGYLRATVEYGLRHTELGAGFRAYLQSVWER